MEPESEEIADSGSRQAELPSLPSRRPAWAAVAAVPQRTAGDSPRSADDRHVVADAVAGLSLLSLGFQRLLLTSLDNTREVRGVIAVNSQATFERVHQLLQYGEL